MSPPIMPSKNSFRWCPIAHGGSAAAYRADVENPQASPLTSEVFAYSKPGDRRVFVWMQNAEPNTLFCADETDGEGLRACEQFMEGSVCLRSQWHGCRACAG